MELSVSVSLLSGALVAQFPVPRNATVFDVKTRLHEDQDGTSVRKQQLVLGCDILQDTTALSELAELGSDHLDLRLVRKEGVSFVWQVPADRGCVTSPEWCLDQSEAVSTRRCALSLRFYPCGFESKMYKEGSFSIMVRRPKNSIVRARVHVAGTVRERVFTSAHGTEEGWVNFASQDLLPSETQDINLEEVDDVTDDIHEGQRSAWSARQRLEVQCFGVVRHCSRADSMGSTWHGEPWVQSKDFEEHPLDPPLSDAGVQEAKDTAERIASFVESKGGEIQVVVCSPYLRCIETASAICRRLRRARLMVDLGLGEVYGPDVFGERPERVTRSDLRKHLEQLEVPLVTVGTWPSWPESLSAARRRFAERLLVYLGRGAKARRNFLMVSHADCVAACLALMPQNGRVVESVNYGATMLAWRMPLPALLTSPRSPGKSRLSGQRAWWGEEGCEAEAWQASEASDRELRDLRRCAWQIETWELRLGHTWCDQGRAVSNAMAALSRKGSLHEEVDLLLGVLNSRTESPMLRRKDSQSSCLSYETYLFGCSEKSLLEVKVEPRPQELEEPPKVKVNDILKPLQSRILQRRRGIA
ncbi:unnamed protein product [Effrenium voratum]|nr:unnamed protein product [Effrenium voratum]